MNYNSKADDTSPVLASKSITERIAEWANELTNNEYMPLEQALKLTSDYADADPLKVVLSSVPEHVNALRGLTHRLHNGACCPLARDTLFRFVW